MSFYELYLAFFRLLAHVKWASTAIKYIAKTHLLRVSDPLRMLGRIQMRQRVVGHQHVALEREGELGH